MARCFSPLLIFLMIIEKRKVLRVISPLVLGSNPTSPAIDEKKK